MRRLWARDASLWTGHDEATLARLADRRPITQRDDVRALRDIRRRGRRRGFDARGGARDGRLEPLPRRPGAHVRPAQAGYPELLVLDSTDPAQIRAFEARARPGQDAVHRVEQVGHDARAQHLQATTSTIACATPSGEAEAGEHFIAITDPRLAAAARRRSSDASAQVFFGVPEHRRALLGAVRLRHGAGRRRWALDVGALPRPRRARWCTRAQPCVPAGARTRACVLGAILGTSGQARAATRSRSSPRPASRDLGAWLEQLLAESTGKQGRGIDPGRPGAARRAGGLRRRSAVRLPAARSGAGSGAGRRDRARSSGPDTRSCASRSATPHDLGQEFFRWEIATAVAGAIIGINPFDQPDVEASKIAARKLTDAYERDRRSLPPGDAVLRPTARSSLFADENNRAALEAGRRRRSVAARLLARAPRSGCSPATTSRCSPTSNMTTRTTAAARRHPHAVRDRRHVATCLGFGPRFLHSTGQAYKGGPNSGVFLQLTCDDARRPADPGQALHLRRRQGRAGARRLRGAGAARPARAARASRARCRRRAESTRAGDRRRRSSEGPMSDIQAADRRRRRHAGDARQGAHAERARRRRAAARRRRRVRDHQRPPAARHGDARRAARAHHADRRRSTAACSSQPDLTHRRSSSARCRSPSPARSSTYLLRGGPRRLGLPRRRLVHPRPRRAARRARAGDGAVRADGDRRSARRARRRRQDRRRQRRSRAGGALRGRAARSASARTPRRRARSRTTSTSRTPTPTRGWWCASLRACSASRSTQIAAIGDMPTDVLMFGVAGMSIAMGNASPEVQRCARYVTTLERGGGLRPRGRARSCWAARRAARRRRSGCRRGTRACLFDLDGVLTQTAKLHAAAWKQMFDDYLRERAQRDRRAVRPVRPGRTTTRATSTASCASTARARSSRRAASSCPTRTVRATSAERKDDAPAASCLREQPRRDLRRARCATCRPRARPACARRSSRRASTASEVLASAGIADLFDARIDGVVAAAASTSPASRRPTPISPPRARVGVDAGAGGRLRGRARRRRGRARRALRLRRRRRPRRPGRRAAPPRRRRRGAPIWPRSWRRA